MNFPDAINYLISNSPRAVAVRRPVWPGGVTLERVKIADGVMDWRIMLSGPGMDDFVDYSVTHGDVMAEWEPA